MLHGRESLIRLIGKRRRAFYSPLARSLRLEDDSNCGEDLSDSFKEHGQLASGGGGFGIPGETHREDCAVEWVACPVCSVSIKGDDFTVNSHLDACLGRGKKRKLSQRTLFQTNFLSNARRRAYLTEADKLNVDDCKDELFEETQLSNLYQPGLLVMHRNCERSKAAEPINPPSCSFEYDSAISVLEVMGKDASKDTAIGSHFPFTVPSVVRSPRSDTCEYKDSNHVLTLETFIVGRRFHEKIGLQCGAKIFALRDRENAKDDNAIKVFCEYQGCKCSLGYLPRQLAKHLSPLIENHYLKCEGLILSLPEHSSDAVPIILFCQKEVHVGDIIYDHDQDFNTLWEKVRFASESTKSQYISMTKYQQNFHVMLRDVMDKHSHVFTNDEKNLIGYFSSFSEDAQRLFIRLYTRKGPWFRLSYISYKEISDLNTAIHELQRTGYLCSFSSGDLPFKYNMKEVLHVLTVSELQQISKQVLSKKGLHHHSKQELVEYILSACKNGACPLLQKMVLDHVGTCVIISCRVDMILWRIQKLFFLNGEQDLSAFLLVDIGLIKFPEYACSITEPIFKSRTDFLEYEEAIEVAQIVDESIDANDKDTTRRCIEISVNHMLTNFSEKIQSSFFETQLQFFSYFSASWVYSKVVTLGVSICEREHRFADAVRLLRYLLKRFVCDSRRGYWTLRLSIDLEHHGYINESLSIAEKGVEDPWIRAGSKIALQRRVLRLGKPPRRWKIPSYAPIVNQKIKEVTIIGRPLNNETGEKSLFYGCDDDLCGVEQLALQYYAEEGGRWFGIHSESSVWLTIFGLLMWDVIFSDVPNVFRSRFQVAPLDLLTDDFYMSRKSLIETQLQKIQEGMAEELLIASWQLHQGTACHGVNWNRFSLSSLRAAVSCIGGRCLASLCRHLAVDYRCWSSGMPDLLLWRFHGGDADGGEAKLVEVKGPRDRLSEQQRAWILILMDCGFHVEVCRVSPPR